MLKKLTIICVTFNAENYIERTLHSIKNQIFEEFEILVIDGASTDSTIERIEEFKLESIRIISEPDLGIYDAMNKGIKLCNTEWFIFLNAGDVFVNKFTLYNVFNLLNGDTLIAYGNTRIKDSNKIVKPTSFISKYYFFSHTICHQSVLINKKVIDLIGFHNINYKVIADRDFFYRASLKNVKFQKIDVDISMWDPVGYSSNNISIYCSEVFLFRENFSFLTFPIIYILNKTIYVQ